MPPRQLQTPIAELILPADTTILNGRRLTLTNDEDYDMVMKVAAGELDHVEDIAAILQAGTAPRPQKAHSA